MKKIMLIAGLACVFAAVAVPERYHDRDNERHHERGTRVWLPLGLSIIAPPVQLPNPAHTVLGGMVNLGYGQMENIAILDLGIVNNVTGCMTGLEVGAVNLAGTCIGAQVGAVNVAGTTVGLQVGAINFTSDLHGVQLGLVNISTSGGALVFPIFNLGF